MKRRLQNLERLCKKMHSRYGETDPVVQLLHTELSQAAVQHKNYAQWRVEYQRRPCASRVRLGMQPL